MAISPKPLERKLTPDEQLVLNAFFEARRDSARASVIFELRPWAFTHDGKFVLMMNCSQGPVGEMTLVNSLHEAISVFGKDIFDQKNESFDSVNKACYQILLNEPVYIVRTFRPKFTESQSEGTPEMCPKQVPDHLEEFLLKAVGLKEWPTRGNPIHWHIVIKDEDWFNELVNLHQNEDRIKGDFTEINFVPDNFIHIAGWRGNTMFTLPLYPKKEKPVYTLKEGIKKISEFIIAGKIKVPGFEYN